jgi:Zn-dependent oligopeptidase
MGFKDKDALINVLSVIMNETPNDSNLNSQITTSSLESLKEFFKQQDKKLKEVLSWDEGYYS